MVFARCPAAFSPGKKRAGEELAIFVLVEPRALDVEEVESGEAGERQRVN
jgi:hypothetical protein